MERAAHGHSPPFSVGGEAGTMPHLQQAAPIQQRRLEVVEKCGDRLPTWYWYQASGRMAARLSRLPAHPLLCKIHTKTRGGAVRSSLFAKSGLSHFQEFIFKNSFSRINLIFQICRPIFPFQDFSTVLNYRTLLKLMSGKTCSLHFGEGSVV
jgi:hypothetical protein